MDALRTWAYTVRPGDTVTDAWPLREFGDNRYQLRVYGPNGFYREFKGDTGDPAVDIRFGYEAAAGGSGPLTGNGLVHLVNKGGACQIDIVDHGYAAHYPSKQLPAGEEATIALPLAMNRGWYDFSVRVPGHDRFERRYAGRIETGRDSTSDPVMGRV
jgi:phospholipase C